MTKLTITLFSAILLSLSVNSWACTSDFSCGIGYTCVKAPLKSNGECMKSVDEYGARQYNVPDSDSIGPNMNLNGQCDFNTDCPIGFRCDRKLKACVKS